MKAAALCGTDVRMFKMVLPVQLPIILYLGMNLRIIEEVGVKWKSTVGMGVCLQPNIGCGVCARCIGGQMLSLQ